MQASLPALVSGAQAPLAARLGVLEARLDERDNAIAGAEHNSSANNERLAAAEAHSAQLTSELRFVRDEQTKLKAQLLSKQAPTQQLSCQPTESFSRQDTIARSEMPPLPTSPDSLQDIRIVQTALIFSPMYSNDIQRVADQLGDVSEARRLAAL